MFSDVCLNRVSIDQKYMLCASCRQSLSLASLVVRCYV